MKNSVKIGLALSDGGARGLSHIGVIDALHNDISFSYIAGTSIGAVIGAMYCATKDPEWIYNRFELFFNTKEFKSIGLERLDIQDEEEPSFWEDIGQYVKEKLVINLAIERKGILKPSRLRQAIEFLVPTNKFSKLKIPFSCVAVDLNSGKDIIYESGNLIDAIVASAAIPGYLQPIEKDDKLLVDGGVSMPIPVDILKNHQMDFIIAVEAGITEFKPIQNPNLLKILGRAEQISTKKLSLFKSTKADLTIRPDTMNLFWSEFDKMETLFVNGKAAGKRALEKIDSMIRKKQDIISKLGAQSNKFTE